MQNEDNDYFTSGENLSASLKLHGNGAKLQLQDSQNSSNDELNPADALLSHIRIPNNLTNRNNRYKTNNNEENPLMKQRKPFAIPPLTNADNRRKQPNTMRMSSMANMSKNLHKRSQSNFHDADEGKLNNVKVTDFKTKEMELLTSQIFDIKSEEMRSLE